MESKGYRPIEEIEKQFERGGERKAFPEHDMAGVLASTMLRFGRGYIPSILPADFYQEVALFLHEHCPDEVDGEKVDYKNLSQEKLEELLRAFGRQMHHFETDNNLRYQRHKPELSIDPHLLTQSDNGEEDESQRLVPVDDFWENMAETCWFQLHRDFCKQTLESSSRGDSHWKTFSLYLEGNNPREISRLLGNSIANVRALIIDSIKLIRMEHGVDSAEEIIVPQGGSMRFKKGTLERGDEKVWVDIPEGATGPQVKAMFNIGMGTAYEMIKRAKANGGRAWYMPNVGASKANSRRTQEEPEESVSE